MVLIFLIFVSRFQTGFDMVTLVLNLTLNSHIVRRL